MANTENRQGRGGILTRRNGVDGGRPFGRFGGNKPSKDSQGVTEPELNGEAAVGKASEQTASIVMQTTAEESQAPQKGGILERLPEKVRDLVERRARENRDAVDAFRARQVRQERLLIQGSPVMLRA